VTSGILLDHYFAAAEEAIRRATAVGPKPEMKIYTQKSPFYFEAKGTRDLPKLFHPDRYRWISDKGYDDLCRTGIIAAGTSSSSRWRGAAHRRGALAIRMQAAAIDRTHPYDFLEGLPQRRSDRDGTRRREPRGECREHGQHQPQRTLALVELASEKPQWFEWTVDLDRGEEPEARFRNGAPAGQGTGLHRAERRRQEGHPELEAIGKLGKGEIALADAQGLSRSESSAFREIQVKGRQLDQWPTPGHASLYGGPRRAGSNQPRQHPRAGLKFFAGTAFRRPLNQGELSSPSRSASHSTPNSMPG